MPGPMFGNHLADHTAYSFHARCQKGKQCKGPGCRVTTGKTSKKRGSYRKGKRK